MHYSERLQDWRLGGKPRIQSVCKTKVMVQLKPSAKCVDSSGDGVAVCS
jgi:hypothetical protein